MLIDRLTDSLPVWSATPLSILTGLAAFAGAGCLFAAAAFGAYDWAYAGLGAFAASGLLSHVADRVSARR